MQCTGAAKPGVSKWTITRRGPVIAGVMLTTLKAFFFSAPAITLLRS